ncbi:MAG: T9SS type A sorting domain-containing protein [Bacteroidota bacterium]|nr:T9SS type A sorting domain-containing protein [Bacteroidota bacterium]
MKPTTPRILPLIIFLAAIFCFGESYGQGSSAAFDPDCYFPKIGVPGQIDTIYGAHNNQYLGDGMINLGPNPNNTFGRISCALDTPALALIFKSWPSFDLHKPDVLEELQLSPNYKIVRFGHFRSAKYRDILAIGDSWPARIFWQDSNGSYDSSRYTSLVTHLVPKNANDYGNMRPYCAHISSDSVEDIIYSVSVNNTNSPGDSVYLLYFKGGESLSSKDKTAYADSTIFFDLVSAQFEGNGRIPFYADFRGVGREDLIASDVNGNMFYYQNDPPFSMANVAHALISDTIYAQWQNPKSVNHLSGMPMQALSKPPGDSSYDLLAFFTSDYPIRRDQQVQEYRIFKGGKNFGSHHWTADSAAFVLHEPYYYDSKYGNMSYGALGGIRDCGHMTGTKNRVLYVEGLLDGGFYGYEFFYVLGDAIDDKIDMEIGPIPNHGGAGNFVDTLVADGDNFQDIIMGESGYGLNNGNEQNGSIFVVHGSNKIPDRTSSVSARRSVDESPSHILAYPNPCSGHTVLTFDNCSASKMKIQVVSMSGVEVLQDETPAVDGLQQYAVDLSAVPAGEYIVNLSCPLPGWSSSVKVVKQGAAVKPWTFDLKKMVGR